jgi:hypothetical protein
MNNLIIILTFFVVLVVLFWIMPNKKAEVVTKCLTSLLQVLPISKICNAIMAYYENKKKTIQ